MVLTITVVGNGQANGNGGHAVLSPNELAQIMSGQTVTGLLNPDGSITLNSNVMSAQQLASMPTNLQNGTISSTTGPSSYQPSRLPIDQISSVSNNSISSLQAITNESSAHLGINSTANNHSQNNASNTNQKKSGQKRLTAKQKLAQQQQQLQQQQQQQLAQNQSQQQMQLSDSRQIMVNQQDQSMGQQPQVVATVQLPNGQIGQLIAPSGGQLWSPNAINLQQLSMAVAAATGSMPQPISIPSTSSTNQAGGQIGSPVMQQQSQQQQQSQMPIQQNNGQQQNTQSLGNQQQQQVVTTVQLPNNQIGHIVGRPGSNQIWSGGPISLSQLTALAQQGVVQLSPATAGMQTGSNGQRIIEMVPQAAIQGLMGQNGQHMQALPLSAGGQFIAQDPNDPGKWQVVSSAQLSGQPTSNNRQTNNGNINDNNSRGGNQNQNLVGQNCNVSSDGIFSTFDNISTPTPNTIHNDNAQSNQPQRKLKRLACTCPNCRDGDNSRSGSDKKKQHICHFPDCNKVYGKTSHLRAHLRWHSGERPYVCNWSFCGKKFTRSDELQRHRRTHTGEKRFQCSECLKRFMRSDHLSKHLKTHLSSKKVVSGQQQESSEVSTLVDLPQNQVKVEVL